MNRTFVFAGAGTGRVQVLNDTPNGIFAMFVKATGGIIVHSEYAIAYVERLFPELVGINASEDGDSALVTLERGRATEDCVVEQVRKMFIDAIKQDGTVWGKLYERATEEGLTRSFDTPQDMQDAYADPQNHMFGPFVMDMMRRGVLAYSISFLDCAWDTRDNIRESRIDEVDRHFDLMGIPRLPDVA